MQHELIFPYKYLYDGIQNIQFDDSNPKVFLNNNKSRVYIDVKFTNYGTYKVYANVNFNTNKSIILQSGIMYPGEKQHPIKPINQKILNPNNVDKYVFAGEIYLLEGMNLIQPVYIKLNSNLVKPININSIMIKGEHIIEYPYTEWWNKDNNTGKRPYQHANHIVANSIFNNITNPTHMYREMIILKWHMHTYVTAINGPSTYMGIDFAENKIVFSVWNAVNNNVEIKNKVIMIGNNVKSNAFDHEGSGSYFEFKGIKLMMGNKYGFYIKYDENETENKTLYSGYFIDLGPISLPYMTPTWIHIGTVEHYNIYNKESRIGGFLENYMTANGHLYQRSVVIGNGWMSNDGINWVASHHEEAVLDELNMQQASTYNDGMITYNIGARLGMIDEGLKHHGNLRTYDLYRDPTICIKPMSLSLLN